MTFHRRQSTFDDAMIRSYQHLILDALRWNKVNEAEKIVRQCKTEHPRVRDEVVEWGWKMIKEKRKNARLRAIHGPGVDG